MGTKKYTFWDFKSYDEKGWFRFLTLNISIACLLYLTIHVVINLCFAQYNYEYDTISKEKMTLINQITVDTSIKSPVARAGRIMQYLDNIFNFKIERRQRVQIGEFLSGSSPTEINTFLSITRFKVESYFWLIGPFVYLEIVFCAVFGVLSSLLFNMGILAKNSTTDMANPQSAFDASEVPYQVAKILYAPICTLAVILGYNYFKDENIVDISSSKGVMTFAFIGGFYSGRLIALMDRLKDILLPTNGNASSSSSNSGSANVALISQLMVKVKADPARLSPQEVAAIGADGLNDTDVLLTAVNTQNSLKGSRLPTDPPGMFTFKDFAPGNYMITAKYKKVDQIINVNLTGSITGQINSGIAPIEVIMK